MHHSSTIEVLISDSRSVSRGSQFGHAAIAIDGVVYGRAHPGWDVDNVLNYLNRQQTRVQRDTIGYLIHASEGEKRIIISEIRRRRHVNRRYSHRQQLLVEYRRSTWQSGNSGLRPEMATPGYHSASGFDDRSAPFETIDWNPTISEEMTRFLLLAILTAMIGACSKHGDEKWTALQDMPAFAEPNDDRSQPIFTVKRRVLRSTSGSCCQDLRIHASALRIWYGLDPGRFLR